MTSSWRAWTFDDWNDALLRHFFVAEMPGEDPVRRLLVTYDELARATGDSNASGDDVRSTLRAVMHQEMALRGRSIVSSAKKRIRGQSWTEDSASSPPFVLHLVMTCLAASDVAGELVNEGNFRVRLGQLTDWSDTQSMDDLPQLWESLVDWLARRVAADEAYRPLVLPDPGWEKKIGYSKNLAFPAVRDQQQLVRILLEPGLLGDEPPVRETLTLLTEHRYEFSTGFQDALSQLSCDYRQGKAIGDSALWSAIRDAALRDPSAVEVKAVSENWRVLVQDIDGSFLPLVVGRERYQKGEFETEEFEPSSHYLREFRWALKAAGEGGDPFDAAFRRTLLGDQAGGAPDVRALRRSGADGVLLFASVPGTPYWELVARKPDSENVVALIRDELAEAFMRVVMPRVKRAWTRRSPIPGWTAVSDLACDNFGSLNFANEPVLEQVRALQTIARPPSLRTVGGLRLGNRRFLGVRGALPAIVIEDATAVVAQSDGTVVDLEQVDHRTWQFPGNVQPADDSEFVVEGTTSTGRVRTKLRFANHLLTTAYRWPEPATRWRLEGPVTASVRLSRVAETGSRVTSLMPQSDDWSAFLAPSLGLGPIPGEIRHGVAGCDWQLMRWPESGEWELRWTGAEAPKPWDRSYVGTRAAKRAWYERLDRARGPERWLAHHEEYLRRGRVHPSPPSNNSVPDQRDQDAWLFDGCAEPSPRVPNLERALAAMSSRRCGLPERDVLDLFRKLLGVWDWRLVWDVIRGWREVGALVRASDMQWRSVTYFAVPPRIVMFRVTDRIGVTLVGLSTQTLRDRFSAEVNKLGGTIRDRKGVSPYVPIPPGAFLASVEDAEELGRRLEVEPVWLCPLPEVVGSVEGAAEVGGQFSHHYPLHSCWDWDNGRFDESGEVDLRRGVRINHYRRADSCDVWAVADSEGGVYWWSHSRTWTLLVGYWLADDFSFHPAEENELQRSVPAGIHLPIGVGNLLAVVSPLIPGPRNRTSKPEDGYDYIYPFPTPELRDQVIELLGSIAGLDAADAESLETDFVREELETETSTEPDATNVLSQFLTVLLEYGVSQPSAHPEHPHIVQWPESWLALGTGVDDETKNQLFAAGLTLRTLSRADDPEEVAQWVLAQLDR